MLQYGQNNLLCIVSTNLSCSTVTFYHKTIAYYSVIPFHYIPLPLRYQHKNLYPDKAAFSALPHPVSLLFFLEGRPLEFQRPPCVMLLSTFLPASINPPLPSLTWKASSPFTGSVATALSDGGVFPILTLLVGVLALKRKSNLLL